MASLDFLHLREDSVDEENSRALMDSEGDLRRRKINPTPFHNSAETRVINTVDSPLTDTLVSGQLH